MPTHQFATLLTTALFVAATAQFTLAADVSMQEGVVVSAGKNSLTITDKQNKQHSYQVGEMVPVRINGKNGKLEDLKKTTPVTVTIDKKGAVMQVATIDLMKKLADSRRYWR
jgi:hypothetical protein